MLWQLILGVVYAFLMPYIDSNERGAVICSRRYTGRQVTRGPGAMDRGNTGFLKP